MDEYIKRDEIWAALNAAECRYVKKIERAIEDIPAADVREVVNTCATCAYCNRDIAVGGWNGSCRYWNTHSVMFDDWCSRYRPNCGADTREGE